MKSFLKGIDKFIVNMDFIDIIAVLVVLITDIVFVFVVGKYDISCFHTIVLITCFSFNFSFIRILIDSFYKKG